jgi:hypothetical protein
MLCPEKLNVGLEQEAKVIDDTKLANLKITLIGRLIPLSLFDNPIRLLREK